MSHTPVVTGDPLPAACVREVSGPMVEWVEWQTATIFGGFKIKAHEFLKNFFTLHPQARPLRPEKGGIPASNSDLRRWLENHSILVNGDKPGPADLVALPVTELVFFPKNPKTRITML